ncbi:hypothetical protein AXG93_725s1060 [Marchantia polymorpha subsp. ruderalis]|uniref:Uncharacterized protein n=1 Tax=Marchantia polymorpha subsp. ruderalis TaxID=1480154 RepID=A0A176WE69_MARPO|nr:hypothetical protein AXG93_725s1060 [Marchantia polymorpha subsp. ruderalis]
METEIGGGGGGGGRAELLLRGYTRERTGGNAKDSCAEAGSESPPPNVGRSSAITSREVALAIGPRTLSRECVFSASMELRCRCFLATSSPSESWKRRASSADEAERAIISSLKLRQGSMTAAGASARAVLEGSSSLLFASPRRASSNLALLAALLLSLLLLAQAQAQSAEEFSVDRTALNQQIQTAAFQSTGRLRRYGFQFGEVNLPVGVKVEENLRHVVLVYRSFKDYNFHNATAGSEFAAPVVGVLVYNGTNLTNFDPLPELRVTTTARPIEVTVANLNTNNNNNINATCVLFNDTDIVVSNFTSPSSSSCSWTTLGDFALLVPRVMDSPGGSKSSNNAWKIAVGAVAGAIVLLGLLSLVALVAVRYRERAKFAKMERVADHGETLHHTLIGGGRAPAAASTRTKPVLESDYISPIFGAFTFWAMHQQQQQWQSVVVMVVVVDMAAGKTDSFEDLKITISSRGRRNKVSQEWPNARDGMFVFTWDLPLALSYGGVGFPITPSNFHLGGPRNAARGARDSTA